MSTLEAQLEAQKRMCLHKRVYQSRGEAKRIARQTQRSRGERQHRCRPYQCAHCGFWHVTSQMRQWSAE